MSKKKFTFIDLFSGIGGFHVGLHKLGGKCLLASDIYEKANETYKTNLGLEPIGDISRIESKDIPFHDILCAGFPCQPFSNVGQKGGLADPRGELIYDVVRILRDKQPKAFILENVKGLLSLQGGKTFTIIFELLKQSGYKVYTDVLEAKDYGLPQIRKRLFFVGIREDLDNGFKFPQPIPLKYTLSNVFDNKKVEREYGFTVRVGGRRSGIKNRYNWDAYYVDGEVTIITPEQCLLLQGFPKDYVVSGNMGDKYKQAGNSVPTTVITELGKQLRKHGII
jgi:DNA (cytosine-5)-methyltransferase 1